MGEESSIQDEDLRTLLSTHNAINDWEPVYQRVKRFPEEARERYYRDESPLQLLLKAKELKFADVSDDEIVDRIQVLRLIIAADPLALTSRDADGRTALHTACSAGQSWEILQLLVEEEEELSRQMLKLGGAKINELELVVPRSVMHKTDRPGGHLPLHLVAACSSFDASSLQDSSSLFPYSEFDDSALQSSNSECVIAAYNATTFVREAYPSAIWERDCDGEIPLHAAASWGNLGSVQSLLIGASMSSGNSCTGAIDAALAVDDNNKTPLDNVSQTVCSMSVHQKPFSAPRQENFRVSIAREDPFMLSTATRNPLMNGNIQLSVNRSRRRIPGVRSSLRSSFTSSTSDPLDISMLRDSFISSRQPVDPVNGLKPLCEDGKEEFVKFEMLARAARGQFYLDNGRNINSFAFPLHGIIELGCPPELVWHCAATYPYEVEKLSESGKSPLFIAAEKLSGLTQQRREEKLSIKKTAYGTSLHIQSVDKESDDSDDNESPFLDSDSNTEANQTKVDAGIQKYKEIIGMLIKSKIFGIPTMASIQDSRGRLPLHVLLEAGALWIGVGSSSHDLDIIGTFVEADPQSLLTKDHKTGMFPFQIAAISCDLDTIFRLLAESPSVITYCTEKIDQ